MTRYQDMADLVARRTEFGRLQERLDLLSAHNHALEASLRALVAFIQRECGYMTVEDQRALREAGALLVEGERR